MLGKGPYYRGLLCTGLSSYFCVLLTMPLNRGRMVEHSRARKALAEADSTFTPDALLSAYWDCPIGTVVLASVMLQLW